LCETDDFIFNSFRNFKPVKRFQNKSDVLEFGAWTTVRARAFGCVGDDLFEFWKTIVQTVTVVKLGVYDGGGMFWRCEGQGRDGYSGEHECDGSRI